jgi:hypothetical protein
MCGQHCIQCLSPLLTSKCASIVWHGGSDVLAWHSFRSARGLQIYCMQFGQRLRRLKRLVQQLVAAVHKYPSMVASTLRACGTTSQVWATSSPVVMPGSTVGGSCIQSPPLGCQKTTAEHIQPVLVYYFNTSSLHDRIGAAFAQANSAWAQAKGWHEAAVAVLHCHVVMVPRPGRGVLGTGIDRE